MTTDTHKPTKRLHATLPPKLANFVTYMTGENGLYETPSEFIRDLIRRYMENIEHTNKQHIDQLLTQAIEQQQYTPLATDDINTIKNIINE